MNRLLDLLTMCFARPLRGPTCLVLMILTKTDDDDEDPWVEQGHNDEEDDARDSDSDNRRVRRFIVERRNKFVDNGMGLGRYPSQWWTMNCKYNAAYDVQRLNVCSQLGDMSVDEAFMACISSCRGSL